MRNWTFAFVFFIAAIAVNGQQSFPVTHKIEEIQLHIPEPQKSDDQNREYTISYHGSKYLVMNPIEEEEKNSTGRKVVGALVGAGCGFLLGVAIADSATTDDLETAVTISIVGTVVGAGIGIVLSNVLQD